MNELAKHIPDRAITITIGNYKGGVGKTTNAVLIGYMLAKKGIKTLVVDLDPQANATKTLMLTRLANQNDDDIMTIKKTLMVGISEGSLEDLPINVVDNLDILPSNIDFEDFAKYLYKVTNSSEEEDFLISNLLEPLKSKYDIILIDVPPMSKEVTRNAVVASDYVLISLQTQESSLTGAENYINELDKISNQYDLNLIVLGIIPILLENKGTVDRYIIEQAKEEFGEANLFEHIVRRMERIKRFFINGITEKDRFDNAVIATYDQVTDEFIKRLNYYESEEK